MSVNKNNNGVLQKIAGGTLYADAPIGCIQAFGGATAPAGWMLCQGQALSRTTYSALFKVIGTSFGAGNGSTTFNIPDLRGEFLRGAGTNSHTTEGNGGAVGEHQDATKFTTPYVNTSNTQFAALYSNYGFTNTDKISSDTSIGYSQINASRTSGGGWQVCKTRPTNTSVNYIIKVMQSSVPLEMMDNYSTDETVIGTWIDGKPIYRKVYTGLNFSLVAGQWVNVGVTIPNVDILVTGRVLRQVNGTRGDIRDGALQVNSNGAVSGYTMAGWGSCNMIILEYTKTTD